MKIPFWRQRFLASTRGKILALLRADSRTVSELADALELTDNAVRSHLATLERDGLVQQLGTRRGFRKPHVLYSPTAEAGYLFPTAYGSLFREAISVFRNRLTPQQLQTGLREVGRSAAQEHLDQIKGKTLEQRIEVALLVLRALGGDVTFEDVKDKRFIRANGCVLAAITARHPEACLIAEALLSEIIGVPVRERCRRGEVPRCCFEIDGAGSEP